jgi:hypothetical protein
LNFGLLGLRCFLRIRTYPSFLIIFIHELTEDESHKQAKTTLYCKGFICIYDFIIPQHVTMIFQNFMLYDV